jgi:hypothetical protein
MTRDVRKRFVTQLNEVVGVLRPLDTVIGAILTAPKTHALGIRLLAATFDFGARGEWALVNGDDSGWQLLAAARKARALAFLLAPSVANSPLGALAMLEAIQWDELETAKTVSLLMAQGYAGDWPLSDVMISSETEIESLAIELLAQSTRDTKLKRRFAKVNLVPLSEFAGAAGVGKTALDQAFQDAFDNYVQMCKDSQVIPRGARLSGAPVFACIRVRQVRKSSVPSTIEHALFSEPFSSYWKFRDCGIDDRVLPAILRGLEAADKDGFKLSPI